MAALWAMLFYDVSCYLSSTPLGTFGYEMVCYIYEEIWNR